MMMINTAEIKKLKELRSFKLEYFNPERKYPFEDLISAHLISNVADDIEIPNNSFGEEIDGFTSEVANSMYMGYVAYFVGPILVAVASAMGGASLNAALADVKRLKEVYEKDADIFNKIIDLNCTFF